MPKQKRKRLFVDPKVQGSLVLQLVRYWLLSIAAAGGLTVVGWICVTPGMSAFVGPRAYMADVFPMLTVGVVASAMVLVVVILNCVRFSHRIVGPLVRLKRHLREAADGGPMKPLSFRDDDFWPELAEAYNDLIARIAADRPAQAVNSMKSAAVESSPSKAPAKSVVGVGGAEHGLLGAVSPASV